MTLPTLVEWSGSADDWSSYIDDIYNRFLQTFVNANHTYLNKPVKARWHTPHDDKHFSFWHVVSEAGNTSSEEDRNIDTERCKRIEWIGHILNNQNNTTDILCWVNERTTKRGKEKRHLLYLHEERFLVVLAEKEWGFLLVTAYVVRNRSHQKLLKEKEGSSDPRVS